MINVLIVELNILINDLHEIEIQQEVYDIQFSDGTNYQIPKRRKIIEVRYELSNNDYY
ncbi:MAG: hypothetical protein IT280_13270 [Ignavibacteria bacterium]|nr:hypothetical protein [Ignavibacteria bacterium]